MNRRKFIALAGASALGAPFLIKQIGVRSNSKTLPAPDRTRRPLELATSASEQKVLAVLQTHSKGAYLLGGCVIGKIQKQDLPYVNLVVDSENFAQIKNDLFQLGVEPVSTPELPASVIRFGYQGKAYSVVNLSLNDYLKQNTLSSNLGLIPFAHNFLVYSFDKHWVIDPYDAFAGKSIFSKAHRIQLLQEPASPVAGLTCSLAATFDTSLLGLKESAACARLTRRCLEQTPDAEETHLVMEQVINYVPDVLETCGLEATQKYLLSPLCLAAARDGAGIDLRRVNTALVAAKRRGALDGSHLMGALNKEFLRKKNLDGLGFGLSDYMAVQGFMVRRTDLLMTSMKTSPPQLAAA